MTEPPRDPNSVDWNLWAIDESNASRAELVFAAEIRRLRATIARVETLSLKWMDYVALQTGEGIPDCAADLEAALKVAP